VNIFLVGEAATHAEKLAAHLTCGAAIVPLPREAAHAPDHDGRIAPEDVVVSLRFNRPGDTPPFRLLHVPGAGLDGIDMASVPPSATVCNVFEHEIPIAEYVALAMLEWQIRLRDLTARFTAGGWSDLYRNRPPHAELYGKTLLLIGLGRIGRAIATRARAFGMRVLAVDGYAQPLTGLVDRLYAPKELEEALPSAEFVVIACPLTEDTRGVFNSRTLARMRREAVLINISRAEIAREEDLYIALRDKVIAGAVLDVWYRYPKGAEDQVEPASQPFLDLPNVVATPHTSAWTTDLPWRRYAFIAANIDRLARGETLLNVVRQPQQQE
jgi:phosphoglycerate dehydrogenase-like enzyme